MNRATTDTAARDEEDGRFYLRVMRLRAAERAMREHYEAWAAGGKWQEDADLDAHEARAAVLLRRWRRAAMVAYRTRKLWAGAA